MNKKQVYLSKIKIKNYKSIKNLEIDFHPDFNILIGRNGSGKTNVLSLSFMSLWSNFDDVENNFETEINIKDKNKLFQLYSTKEDKPIEPKDILRSEKRDDYSFQLNVFDNKNNLQKSISEINLIKDELSDFYTTFIRHGLPKKHLYFFEEPFSYTFSKNNSKEIKAVIRDTQTPYFIRFFAMYYQIFYLDKYNEFVSKEIVVSDVYDFFNINYRTNLKHILGKFTEIEDVKLNGGLFINEIDKGAFSIKNIFFEFKIYNKWLPFSSLSDGLQRIIIILSEVAIEQIRTKPFSKEKSQTDEEYNEINVSKRIVLLEEPELGIHPHLLFKFMTFLKEASQRNQIIISTHSPEILDHLDKDELDKIIICTNQKDVGTHLKRLSKTEIEAAQDYMADLDLSDYWKHSDLER